MALTLVAVLLGGTASAGGRMTVKPLPIAPECNGGFATGINSRGDAVGYIGCPGVGIMATAWSRGGDPMSLSPLPGYTESRAVAINWHGIAVGVSASDDLPDLATLWDGDGNAMPLAPLPGDTWSSASAINVHGEVVGSSGGPVSETAVVWNADGEPSPLAALDGSTDSRASGINDRGEIVGRSGGPVRWDADGNPTPLPLLPGFSSAFPVDINNRGSIAGRTSGPGFSETAMVWDRDLDPTHLPLSPHYLLVTPTGMNEHGQISGGADLATEPGDPYARAFILERDGSSTLLPFLPGGAEAAFPFARAFDINNLGEAVGYSRASNGQTLPVIWTRFPDCGHGFELALVVPPVAVMHRRRERRRTQLHS